MNTFKYLISTLFNLTFIISLQGQSPSDFSYDLNRIASSFRNNIMDKDECDNQKNRAYQLADEIDEALDDDDEYDSSEISELKKLKREVEALEEFIAAVGDCGNGTPTIDQFNQANSRVRGSVSWVYKDKYCVDVIAVTIGEYRVFLAQNSTTSNYTLNYKWRAQDKMSSGNGTSGIGAKSLRHIYNNREYPDKQIGIYGLTCQKF
ncbi:hypothetical protein [Roseivirga sp.]|uniref:hypothetical protein n=1 Tax=Roseivirga sp. TaxID=1964215 RepID=UPI003B8DE711